MFFGIKCLFYFPKYQHRNDYKIEEYQNPCWKILETRRTIKLQMSLELQVT